MSIAKRRTRIPRLVALLLPLVSFADTAEAAPLPDWPVAMLDMRQESAKPLFAVDLEDRLAQGQEGAISFWLRMDWDDDHCDELKLDAVNGVWPEYKYIYAHSSVGSARFRIAVKCDRDTLRLEYGAQGADEASLRKLVRDGKPHHFVLHVDRGGTTVYIDGELATALPVRFGEVGRVPIHVGSNTSGDEKFLGVIGALRVWNRKVDVKALEALKSVPFAELESRPERDALVGYMVKGDTGSADKAALAPVFRVRGRVFDPSGRWLPTEDDNRPQHIGQTSIDGQRNFMPKMVTTIVWTTRCSPLAGKGAGGGRGLRRPRAGRLAEQPVDGPQAEDLRKAGERPLSPTGGLRAADGDEWPRASADARWCGAQAT